MSRPLIHLSTALAVLALVACGESTTPTQPPVPGDEVPTAPSFVVGSNTWTKKAPLPDFSFDMSAATVTNSAGQSIVYALGQHGEENGLGFPIRAYNVATDTWTSTNTIFRVSRTNGIGVIGGKLYIPGGFTDFDGSNCCQFVTLFVYDPATNQLTRKADMPKATADGVTGVINDKLYVLPGTCSGEFFPGPQGCGTQSIRTLYRYNPVTNTWATRPLAPHFHKWGAGGVIDGKFYVVGGELLNAPPVTALDVYDPVTNKWSTRAPMPVGGPVFGAVMNSKLWVILRSSPGNMYVYDPATNTWSSKAKPALLHEALVRVAVNGRNRLLAVGGQHLSTAGVSGIWTLHDSELYTP